MKKIIRLYLPLILVLVLVILFLQPNPYFRKSLIYNIADITDYKIFEERIIESGEHQPWKLSPDYNSYKLVNKEVNFLEEYKTVAFLVSRSLKTS